MFLYFRFKEVFRRNNNSTFGAINYCLQNSFWIGLKKKKNGREFIEINLFKRFFSSRNKLPCQYFLLCLWRSMFKITKVSKKKNLLYKDMNKNIKENYYK